MLESRFPRGAECGEEAPSLRTHGTLEEKSHDKERKSHDDGPAVLRNMGISGDQRENGRREEKL